MIELTNIYEVPPALFAINDAREIKSVFSTPTLLHLKGKCEDRLFVSVLLHGNEDAGLFAVQKLLLKYQNHELPRGLTIFFGNIEAAAKGMRRLQRQKDYNRVWPTNILENCDEADLMLRVVNTMAQYPLFASIDVHNNTGKNPHYGCVNSRDFATLQLAHHFSHLIVYFQNPRGVQAMAFAPFCPSIAIECGKPQTEHGAQHAFEFIDTILHLKALPCEPLRPHTAHIYETIARVCVPNDVNFSFENQNTDLVFSNSLDQYNFTDLPPKTKFATANNAGAKLLAWNDDNQEVGSEYFTNNGGEIVLTKPLTPAMLTLDETIIRQDCLCYLMRKIEI